MKVFVKMVGESWNRSLQIKLVAEAPEDRHKLEVIVKEMAERDYFLRLDSATEPEKPEGGMAELILEKAPEPDPPPDRD